MKNKKTKFNWWILPAVISGAIAVTAIIFYLITLNMALVLLILPSIAGTGFCLYRIINISGATFEGISDKGPIIGEINAFCIYGELLGSEVRADKVQFELVDAEKVLGDRWFFEDLNKWLYVMFNDLAAGGTWRAFDLPDAAYTDPARLSIPLNMGRVNELFQLEPSIFDQLKPWIIFATITVIGFLIFLSGSE